MKKTSQIILKKLLPKQLNQEDEKKLLIKLLETSKLVFFKNTNIIKNNYDFNIILDSRFNELILNASYLDLLSPMKFLKNPKKQELINEMGTDQFIWTLRKGTNPFTKKVSNFPIMTAKTLYEYFAEKLCEDFGCNAIDVLDTSAGWGSRMLASWSVKKIKNYFCFEVNKKLVKQLYRFKQFLGEQNGIRNEVFDLDNENLWFSFILGKSSHYYESTLNNKYHLALISPPYFNREKYSNDNNQSINLFPEYSDWLENYWKATIKNIYQYLKIGGYFAVNVKNIKRPTYNLVNDTLNIADEIGFLLEAIWDIPIGTHKTEPLLVFRKVEKDERVDFKNE